MNGELQRDYIDKQGNDVKTWRAAQSCIFWLACPNIPSFIRYQAHALLYKAHDFCRVHADAEIYTGEAGAMPGALAGVSCEGNGKLVTLSVHIEKISF